MLAQYFARLSAAALLALTIQHAPASAQLVARPPKGQGVSVTSIPRQQVSTPNDKSKDTAGVEANPEMQVPLAVNAKRQLLTTMAGPTIMVPTYANCDTKHMAIGQGNSVTVTGDVYLNNSDTTKQCPDIGRELPVSKDLIGLLQQ